MMAEESGNTLLSTATDEGVGSTGIDVSTTTLRPTEETISTKTFCPTEEPSFLSTNYPFYISVTLNILLLLYILIYFIVKRCRERDDEFYPIGGNATRRFVPRDFAREWRKSRCKYPPGVGSMKRLQAECSFQPRYRVPLNPLPTLPQDNPNRMSVTFNPLNRSYSVEDLSPTSPEMGNHLTRMNSKRDTRLLANRLRQGIHPVSERSWNAPIDTADNNEKMQQTPLTTGTVPRATFVKPTSIDTHLTDKKILSNTPPIPTTPRPSSPAYLSQGVRANKPVSMSTFAIKKAVS